MNKFIRLLPLALAVSSLLGTAAAQAQTVITSLPYTITAKGLYVLNGDLNSSQTSGNLISVNASNVTIDFQGHYISGPASSPSQTTIGIRASERSNLTIKNGTIAYCYQGIYISGDGSATTNNVGHLIENMRVTYCNYVGMNIDTAPSTVIQDCQISKIVGTNNASGGFGIFCSGAGATVVGCSVGSVAAPSGTNYGISVGTGAFAVRNRIATATYGVFSNGGKYQDNVTLSCTTPFSGATDAGGNN